MNELKNKNTNANSDEDGKKYKIIQNFVRYMFRLTEWSK